jgi:hypothetical protein
VRRRAGARPGTGEQGKGNSDREAILFSEYCGPGGYTHAGRVGVGEKRISFLAETLSKIRFFGIS